MLVRKGSVFILQIDFHYLYNHLYFKTAKIKVRRQSIILVNVASTSSPWSGIWSGSDIGSNDSPIQLSDIKTKLVLLIYLKFSMCIFSYPFLCLLPCIFPHKTKFSILSLLFISSCAMLINAWVVIVHHFTQSPLSGIKSVLLSVLCHAAKPFAITFASCTKFISLFHPITW